MLANCYIYVNCVHFKKSEHNQSEVQKLPLHSVVVKSYSQQPWMECVVYEKAGIPIEEFLLLYLLYESLFCYVMPGSLSDDDRIMNI